MFKKIIFLIGTFFLLTNFVYADVVNHSGKLPKNIQKFNQDIITNLNQYPDLTGKVTLFVELKLDKGIDKYKILKYDNENVYNTLDNYLKPLAKNDIPDELSSFEYLINIKKDIVDTQIKVIGSSVYDGIIYQNYFNKNFSPIVEKYTPYSNSTKLKNVKLAITIANAGNVKKIIPIQSSGDEDYDKKLYNCLINLNFGTLPTVRQSGEIVYIATLNPKSKEVKESLSQYYKQTLNDISKEINVYFQQGQSLFLDIDKNGNISNVRFFNLDEKITNFPAEEKFKNIKVTPYNNQFDSTSIEFSYNNIYRNDTLSDFKKYCNKVVFPTITNIIPVADTLKKKPVTILIYMTKNGQIKDIKISSSSSSRDYDNQVLDSLKYLTFKPLPNSYKSDELIFGLSICKYTKFLETEYTNYRKYVETVTFKNIPDPYANNLSTKSILFIIKNDGTLTRYVLLDAANNSITEKKIDNALKNIKFPKFPKTLDADELGFIISLKDPLNSLFMGGLSILMTFPFFVTY